MLILSLGKICLILYPPFENLTTRITMMHNYAQGHQCRFWAGKTAPIAGIPLGLLVLHTFYSTKIKQDLVLAGLTSNDSPKLHKYASTLRSL